MTHTTQTPQRPSRLRALVEGALCLLYPERCQACRIRHALPADGLVCRPCRESIHLVQPPFCSCCGLPFAGAITHRFECPNCSDRSPAFSRARAAVEAVGVAREIVHQFKYQRAFWFEPAIRDLWLPAVLPDVTGQPWDGIVPVPLHPVKQREREYNQAERLARILAAALALPVRTDLVRRTEATPSQTRLRRDQRLDNVRRAFAPTRPLDLDGTRWIVVDDVLTTGATTDAVARVLRQLGAAEVVVWTFARGV